MSQNSLFVAISTRQNIANLLPILELVEPGDAVLWIESATAQRLGWSRGALDVLRQLGVTRIQLGILDDDEPASIHRLLCRDGAAATASRVRLVGNGGTKLQMLAAVQALGARVDELLYNHDQRCILQRYGNGPVEPPSQQHYRRHTVDLPEILRCRNMELVPKRGVRIWPGPLPAVPRFGSDPDYTAEQHESHWRWNRLTMEQEAGKSIPYQDVRALVPFRDSQFRESIRLGTGLPNSDSVGANAAESIYHAARKLEGCAREAALREGLTKPQPIGSELEAAVAARLLRWLDGNPEYAEIIQSVWRSVEVRGRGSTDKLAQLDVALILMNGLVLSLECKAFDSSLKDLDARLGVLQRSSSELARMAICMPCYPAFANSQWNRELERKADKVAGWRQFRFLPFTLPGSGSDLAATIAQTGERSSFEDGLAAWLGSFVAMASKA